MAVEAGSPACDDATGEAVVANGLTEGGLKFAIPHCWRRPQWAGPPCLLW